MSDDAGGLAFSIARSASAAERRTPNHIVLNLPADSVTFLPALTALGCVLGQHHQQLDEAQPMLVPPTVHCYAFSNMGAPQEQLVEARERLILALGRIPLELSVRNIRSVAPGKDMLCYEFLLPVLST